MARLGKLVPSILTALVAIEGIAFAAPADWLLKSNYSQRVAKVAKVSNQKGIADLITIDTGTQSNLRIGALCTVSRQDQNIAQAVVVEADRDRSVALVLNGQQIQTGDAVYITPAN